MVRSFVTGALARLRLTSSGGPPCFAATALKRISAQIVEEFVDLA
jgi:hypothetical protein